MSALAEALRSATREFELEQAAADDRDASITEPGALETFARHAWPTVEPWTEYLSNWHIGAICDRLQAVTAGDVTRLLINIPPRYMKSRLVSVFWPAWVWTLWPESRWMFVSYSQDLATEHSLDRRTIIKSQWYQRRHGDRVKLTSDQNVKTEFRNTARGLMKATSLSGTVTGKGGDVLVIDDPLNPKQAWSARERTTANREFGQTLSSRLNDKRKGAIVLIMQRLHEQDMTGHLLDLGGFEHLCLPAEYEPNHPFVWPEDPRSEAGDLLWPEREGEEEVERAKLHLGSYGFAGQYQQNPAPIEGGLIKRRWWRYYDPKTIPATVQIVHSWDTAFRDRTTSDYVVGQSWGVRGAHRFLLRQARGQWDLPETIRQVKALHHWVKTELYLPQSVVIENSANGPDIVAALRHEIPGVVAMNARGDKTSRVLAVTAQIEAGNVFLPGRANDEGTGCDTSVTPGWVQAFIDECASFPNASHDDQVDAMTQALRRIAFAEPDFPELPTNRNGHRRNGGSSAFATKPLPYGSTL